MKTISGGLPRIKPPCRLSPGEGNSPALPAPVFEPLAGKITDYSRDELRLTLENRGVTLPRREKAAKSLLVGFAETDSGVTLFTRLAMSCPEKILAGATVAMYVYGIRNCVLCVPKSAYRAADALSLAAAGKKQFSVTVISDKYPLYDPRLLVSAVFGAEISPLKPLENSGYAVLSPEKCVLIFESLVLGLPAGKYFSVEGKKSVLVRSFPETPLGMATEIPEGAVVTVGGAVKGREASSETPVAGIDGIILDKRFRGPAEKTVFACDRCGLCDLYCPVRLRPSDAAVKPGGVRDAGACISCRICDSVCPSGISLCDAVKSGGKESRHA